MTGSISGRTVNLRRVFTGECSTTVSTFSTVCVHNDLTSGQSGITMRATDHELAGRIHMVNDIIIEQSLYMSRILGFYARYQDTLYIGCNLLLHSDIGFFLANAFRTDKLVMLSRYNDRIDTQRLAVVIIFNSDLALCIRTEIRHQVVFVLADLSQFP